MSSIPSISRNMPGAYTVAGGVKAGHNSGSRKLSLLLLSRGGRIFNPGYIQELGKFGFDDILCIEGPKAPRDVEVLTRRHPNVRFLILQQEYTIGEQINLGIGESLGEYVFVMWNDMGLLSGGLSSLVIERLFQRNYLCTVPILQNTRGEVLPTLQAPVFNRKYLKMLSLSPSRDGRLTLFPYDFAGIYNRAKFTQAGGYDPEIKTPYWQKMDFGFRAFMWGEKIKCETTLRGKYLGDPPVEDTSPDDFYHRFYLKNLTVRYNGDAGYIPNGRFWSYFFKSGKGYLKARKLFRENQEIVKLHQFRYKYDATSITDLWEEEEL
ncbi:MAG: hypothetical protein JEY99_06965 [Spirochaetales bacterium]|nr:hypothetical protein [Spirochaetales bacterium]